MIHTVITVDEIPDPKETDLFMEWEWDKFLLDNEPGYINLRVMVRYFRKGVNGMNKPVPSPFDIYIGSGYSLYPVSLWIRGSGHQPFASDMGHFHRTKVGDL